jgi:hypothetical protein
MVAICIPLLFSADDSNLHHRNSVSSLIFTCLPAELCLIAGGKMKRDQQSTSVPWAFLYCWEDRNDCPHVWCLREAAMLELSHRTNTQSELLLLLLRQEKLFHSFESSHALILSNCRTPVIIVGSRGDYKWNSCCFESIHHYGTSQQHTKHTGKVSRNTYADSDLQWQLQHELSDLTWLPVLPYVPYWCLCVMVMTRSLCDHERSGQQIQLDMER